MLRWLLRRRIAAFGRAFDYDVSYMMEMLDTDPDAARRFGRRPAARVVQVNGMPGVMAWCSDGRPDVLALEIADGRITALYAVSNPDKLRRVPGYAAALA